MYVFEHNCVLTGLSSFILGNYLEFPPGLKSW